jgi:hypothetical protein
MKTWTRVAGVLAVGTLLAGCHPGIEGSPVTSPQAPTEPSFPTPRPSRSSPAPTTTTTAPRPTGTSTPDPGAGTTLAPQNGYVFIQTKSGKTRCQVSEQDVGCESAFTDPPVVDGSPANGVRLTADGKIRWVLGNLGAIPARTLDYGTYQAVGWTIEATSAGTRFTNNASGHGMVVAVEHVQTF